MPGPTDYTKIIDWDIADNADIKTDKCSDAGQTNKFVTQAQKDAVFNGGNADPYHWHSGFGALAIQFGRNGIVIPGQYLWANGIPSNLAGILATEDGYILSVGVTTGALVAGSDLKVEVLKDKSPFGNPAIVTVPVGQRKGILSGLDNDCPFNQLQELQCNIKQGSVNIVSALVEIRWR